MAKQVKFTSIQKSWTWEEPEYRESSKFRASYSETLIKLEEELDRIDATGAILELDFSKREIYANGFTKPNARERSPRVRLSFMHPEAGMLEYPCDTYTNFEANVRAIALTLENLRALSRYGATKSSQQYAGWQGLPEPEKYVEVPSVEDAALLIAKEAGEEAELIFQSEKFYRYCYREAAKTCHPDNGGSDVKFQQLQSAKAILDKFFKEAEVA